MRFFKIIPFFIILLSIGACFILIKLNLINSSKQFEKDFVFQNISDISSADIYNLAIRLNSASVNENWCCVIASYNNKVFYSKLKNKKDCYNTNLLQAKASINTHGFNISIITELSKDAKIFTALFVLTQISLFFVLLWIKMIEKRRNKEMIKKSILHFKEKNETNILLLNEFPELISIWDEMKKQIKEMDIRLENASKFEAIASTTQMLAHDIRKPFSAIKGFLNILPKKKFDDSFINSSSIQIEQAYKKVENMLEDILEYSRNKPLEQEVCNPQTLIITSITDAVRPTEKTDVVFNYDFKTEHSVYIDTNKVLRVFVNIIGNAIEVLNGKGCIWFGVKDVYSEDNSLQMLEFTIGNNGAVIPADKQSLIFESFFTSGKKKGTGLGLAIAKKIVEEHKGKILVQSFTENGNNITEFVFTLPVSRQSFELKQEDLFKNSSQVYRLIENHKKENRKTEDSLVKIKEKCAELGRKISLAIIDDEALFRNSLRNTITEDDELRNIVDVIEFHSAEEFLANINKVNIDYAIVDIDMGKHNMNGLELAEIIKEKYQQIVFIIHSNRSAVEYREKAIQAGAVGFVPKPMDMDAVIDFLGKNYVHQMPIFAKTESQQTVLKQTSLLNIAVIDDSPISCEYLASLVGNIETEKDNKVHIQKFNSPDAFISALRNFNPDIIITDYNFDNQPDFTGLDLIKFVRQNNARSILYLSTNMQKNDMELAVRELNVSAIFRPDIDRDDLKIILDRDIKTYIHKFKNSMIDYNKLNVFSRKLFHDLEKPVQNASLVLNMHKDAKSVQSQLPEINKIYEQYKNILANSSIELNQQEKEFIEPVYQYYNQQYEEFQNTIVKKLSNTKNTANDLKELSEYLTKLKKANIALSSKFLSLFTKSD